MQLCKGVPARRIPLFHQVLAVGPVDSLDSQIQAGHEALRQENRFAPVSRTRSKEGRVFGQTGKS